MRLGAAAADLHDPVQRLHQSGVGDEGDATFDGFTFLGNSFVELVLAAVVAADLRP